MATRPDIVAERPVERPVFGETATSDLHGSPEDGRAEREQGLADLLLLVGLAVLLPILLLAPIPLVRVPLGLALVLLAPGYAITAALFARRDDLDGVSRAAMSFGLSVAVLPPLALVLDALPWGIRPWPMVLSLSTLVTALSGVAAVRRYRLGASDTTARPGLVHLAPQSGPAAWWWRQPRLRQVGYALSALAAAGTLVWGATGPFSIATTRPLTEFYVLGAAGLAEDYPRAVAPEEEVQLQVGVTNREGRDERYRIEIHAGGKLLTGVAPFVLADGATWEEPIRYTLATTGDDQQIDILLFSSDRPTPYRQLRLYVNVRTQVR